jgi:hypothetical protein
VLRANRVVETAGQPHALFKSGLNFGVAAEGAKCAAVSSKYCCGGQGNETDLAWVAQLVERVLGKDEVTGSIPVPGSRISGRRGVQAENRRVL